MIKADIIAPALSGSRFLQGHFVFALLPGNGRAQ